MLSNGFNSTTAVAAYFHRPNSTSVPDALYQFLSRMAAPLVRPCFPAGPAGQKAGCSHEWRHEWLPHTGFSILHPQNS
jgi:hypothetical protein